MWVVDQRLGHSLRDLVGHIGGRILELLPGEAIELGCHLVAIYSDSIVQLSQLGLGLREESRGIVEIHCDAPIVCAPRCP